MNAIAATGASRTDVTPASVEALQAILSHYGFDHFFTRTLRTIDLSNTKYAEAVDEALERHRDDSDMNTFSLRAAFRAIVNDLMEEDGYSYEEAIEVLAEDDYVVPVTTALYYSVDAGDTDVEYLSTLIRNRAQRILRLSKR